MLVFVAFKRPNSCTRRTGTHCLNHKLLAYDFGLQLKVRNAPVMCLYNHEERRSMQVDNIEHAEVSLIHARNMKTRVELICETIRSVEQ